MLEGKWMLTKITMDGSVFDIKNNTVSLTPEYIAGYKNKTTEQAIAMAIKQMNREMTGNYFAFLGNNLEMKFLADTIDTDKYELAEIKGVYYVVVSTDKMSVRIEGKMMYAELSSESQKIIMEMEKQ